MLTRRMRLSEKDLEVVLKMRGLQENPYRIVNSDTTYRLHLTRKEEDMVAIDRIKRAIEDPGLFCEMSKKALAYIAEDYDITVTVRNKVTGEKVTAKLLG